LLASFDPATNRYYFLTKVGAGVSDKLLRSLPRFLKPYVIREEHGMTKKQRSIVSRPVAFAADSSDHDQIEGIG
jgi:ATP-dependent DNA ligase